MIHPVLSDRLPQVRELLKKNRVRKAYAFGSVCTDHFNSESDIDLLIDFEENLDPLVQGENWWLPARHGRGDHDQRDRDD